MDANVAPTSGLTRSSANWKTSSGRSACRNAWAISRTAINSRIDESGISPCALKRWWVRTFVGFGTTETMNRLRLTRALLPRVRRADLDLVRQRPRRRIQDSRDYLGHVFGPEHPALVSAVTHDHVGGHRAGHHDRHLHAVFAHLQHQ